MALMFDSSLTPAQQAELNRQLPARWRVPLSQQAGDRSARDAAGQPQQGLGAPVAGTGQGINEEDPDGGGKADDADIVSDWSTTDSDSETDSWMGQPPQGDGAMPEVQHAVQQSAPAVHRQQQQPRADAAAPPLQLGLQRQLSATSLDSEPELRVGYEGQADTASTAPALLPRGGSSW